MGNVELCKDCKNIGNSCNWGSNNTEENKDQNDEDLGETPNLNNTETLNMNTQEIQSTSNINNKFNSHSKIYNKVNGISNSSLNETNINLNKSRNSNNIETSKKDSIENTNNSLFYSQLLNIKSKININENNNTDLNQDLNISNNSIDDQNDLDDNDEVLNLPNEQNKNEILYSQMTEKDEIEAIYESNKDQGQKEIIKVKSSDIFTFNGNNNENTNQNRKNSLGSINNNLEKEICLDNINGNNIISKSNSNENLKINKEIDLNINEDNDKGENNVNIDPLLPKNNIFFKLSNELLTTLENKSGSDNLLKTEFTQQNTNSNILLTQYDKENSNTQPSNDINSNNLNNLNKRHFKNKSSLPRCPEKINLKTTSNDKDLTLTKPTSNQNSIMVTKNNKSFYSSLENDKEFIDNKFTNKKCDSTQRFKDFSIEDSDNYIFPSCNSNRKTNINVMGNLLDMINNNSNEPKKELFTQGKCKSLSNLLNESCSTSKYDENYFDVRQKSEGKFCKVGEGKKVHRMSYITPVKKGHNKSSNKCNKGKNKVNKMYKNIFRELENGKINNEFNSSNKNFEDAKDKEIISDMLNKGQLEEIKCNTIPIQQKLAFTPSKSLNSSQNINSVPRPKSQKRKNINSKSHLNKKSIEKNKSPKILQASNNLIPIVKNKSINSKGNFSTSPMSPYQYSKKNLKKNISKSLFSKSNNFILQFSLINVNELEKFLTQSNKKSKNQLEIKKNIDKIMSSNKKNSTITQPLKIIKKILLIDNLYKMVNSKKNLSKPIIYSQRFCLLYETEFRYYKNYESYLIGDPPLCVIPNRKIGKIALCKTRKINGNQVQKKGINIFNDYYHIIIYNLLGYEDNEKIKLLDNFDSEVKNYFGDERKDKKQNDAEGEEEGNVEMSYKINFDECGTYNKFYNSPNGNKEKYLIFTSEDEGVVYKWYKSFDYLYNKNNVDKSISDDS